jgi:hypothetical protein
MLNALAINNGQTRQFTVLVLDVKFLWLPNDVVEVLDRDLDDVILGIVNDADQQDPFCLNLISQVERCYLDWPVTRCFSTDLLSGDETVASGMPQAVIEPDVG